MAQDTFEPKFYRGWTGCSRLTGFAVQVAETDLAVKATRPLRNDTKKMVLRLRDDISSYAAQHPRFYTSLQPLPAEDDAPEVVQLMADASAAYDVGPMAAVAGAIAELVGIGLLELLSDSGFDAPEVIVENGGDCYVCTNEPAVVSLFAGKDSPFSGRRLRIGGGGRARGVCTSSGTVGHSLSYGLADAVVAIAESAALADAAATAIANKIRSREDIQPALEREKSRGKLLGLLIAAGEHLGAWGELEIT